MRNLFFLILTICITTNLSAQNIWTVNNQPNSSADFTTIQDANTNASDGDIIMVQGSPFDYDDATITKRLVIIGPGYFLGQNEEPFTQANPLEAYVGSLILANSASVDASGSIVTGMSVRILTLSTPVSSGGMTDVTIQRCRIQRMSVGYRAEATVKECYIGGEDLNLPIAHAFNNTSTITYENNLVVNASGAQEFTQYATNTTYNNNMFVGLNHTDIYTLGNSVGSNFTNNLILADQDVVVQNSPGIILNNMTNTDLWDGLTSNIANVNPEAVIIGWADPTGLSPDVRYTLEASSPAIDAANDGSNIGPFQDDGGYVLSGIPFVPNIYSITAPNFGTIGSGIDINVKAKANN